MVAAAADGKRAACLAAYPVAKRRWRAKPSAGWVRRGRSVARLGLTVAFEWC